MSESKVHDLRRRYWGHSIEFLRRDQSAGDWAVVIYLSARIDDGDIVLAESQTPGRTLRYRVLGDVDRPMDPGDQHFATLHFEPEEEQA